MPLENSQAQASPEYLIAQSNNISLLMIIDARKKQSILTQQIPCKQQTGIHHAAPIGVKATVTLRVGDQTPTFLVIVATFGVVIGLGLRKVIVVNEIMTRVVRWVDVDHLDLARIRVAKELQRVEVVALDVEILGSIPVNALFRAGAQALVNGAIRLLLGVALAWPGELVALSLTLRHIAHSLFQGLNINRTTQASIRFANLGHHFGKELAKSLNIFIQDVRRS